MKPGTLVILFVPLLLASCGGPRRTPVVVYSPHGKEMLAAFEREYEAQNPGEDVQWLDMGSQDVLDRIRTEKENPQADLWWGAPMTVFTRAEKEGLLERYVPTWDSVVPPGLRSPGGYWYGTFVTPEVIMYNSAKISVAQAPKDWDELLLPAWKEKIVLRSPLASGTMRVILSAMILREVARGGTVESGLAWLRRLDANTRSYAADPTQLYLKIAREEGLVTVWDLPDVMIQIRTNSYPFGFVLPASGTPLITDGIALVRGCRHPVEAKRLYEFLTSRQSAALQAQEFGRIPTRTDIPASELPEWIAGLHLVPLPIDLDTLAVHEKEWMSLWEEQVRGRGRDEQKEH